MCLAVPGQVISIEGEGLERQGLVRFGQIERTISLAMTPDATVDDYVIVHVGLAISVVDEEEAERLFLLLEDAEVMEAVGE